MACVTLICVLCTYYEYYANHVQRRLVLEDGTVFPGRPVGAPGVAAGEACFTTASAGYEQAVTDPSYARQVLAFASPLVGNYGVDERLLESSRVWTEGVVMRRSRPAWSAWLASQGRRRARGDRHARARPASARGRRDALRARHRRRPRSCTPARSPSPTSTGSGCSPSRRSPRRRPRSRPAWTSRTPSAPARASCVLDLGCKRSIVRRLAESGVQAVVVPGSWDADAVLEHEPAAVLIGNGPGDPGAARRAGRDRARPARPRAALRHLPRPPARRARARPARRSSSRSATAARTTRCA